MIDPKTVAAFDEEFKKLADKHEVVAVAVATFTDGLGNKHVFPATGSVGAELRLVSKADLAAKESHEQNGGTTKKN